MTELFGMISSRVFIIPSFAGVLRGIVHSFESASSLENEILGRLSMCLQGVQCYP